MLFSKRAKFSVVLAGAVVCSLLLATGCTQTATLALKFTPQDSTTYRVIALTERSIKFEGSLPKETTFKGGRNQEGIEMTFTQQIQSVNDKGNAVTKITIEGLKYHSTIKDRPVLGFDSSREKARDNPLAKLIGQSYTIEIASTGQVVKVIDVKQAQAAVEDGRLVRKTVLKLFSTDAIKERHGRVVLPAASKNRLRTEDNWSGLKTFAFGMMGSKSYEKIYTVKQIEDIGDRRIAIVDMNAIPTSEMAEHLHKEQATFDFSKMFDNTETYAGRLTLDLTAGKIEEYREKLLSEWVAIEPSAGRGDKEPAVVRMSATRLYSLERVD